MFEVLENDKPAIMIPSTEMCWATNRFATFKEAQIYAYPLDIDSILSMIDRNPFVLNEEKDCARYAKNYKGRHKNYIKKGIYLRPEYIVLTEGNA